MKNTTLEHIFSFFSLTFWGSILGLVINLIINTTQIHSHKIFIFTLIISLVAGIIINIIDRISIQKHIHTEIDTFLQNGDL
jgi:hypothetical protein